MTEYEEFYVRIWNASGTHAIGWLGKDGEDYLIVVDAGIYSNPKVRANPSDPQQILKLRWITVTNGHALEAPSYPGGVRRLQGSGSNGINAYWRTGENDYYPLTLAGHAVQHDVNVPKGTLVGLPSRVGGDNAQLYTKYYPDQEYFNLTFGSTGDETQSKFQIKLPFTPETVLFEFVPVSLFDTRPTYAPRPSTAFHTQSWTRDLDDVIGNRVMRDIVIPGSHDAATYNMESPDLTNQRSQCQTKSIYTQLVNGSRYLDLRIAKAKNGKYYGYHGKDWTWVELSEIVTDIKNFMTAQPKEILIASVLVWDWEKAPGPGEAWDYIINNLGPLIFPRVVVDQNGKSSIRFIQNASPRVIRSCGNNIMLFVQGYLPSGTVLDGTFNGASRANFIWPATPPDSGEYTSSDKSHPDLRSPWQKAFDTEKKDCHTDLDFDLVGIFFDSFNTAAADLRNATAIYVPPPGKQLWILHANIPTSGGGDWIITGAKRMQPLLAQLVREDINFSRKLNIVNHDFVGEISDLTTTLIAANLTR